MEQLVHITDLHIANRPPVNRVDDYNSSIFAKLKWVCEYCQKCNVKRLVITGDLSHSHKLDDALTNRFVSLILKYELEVIYIYGNHDLEGRNKNFTEMTNFGLLEKYPWFKCVTHKPVVGKNYVIAGYDFGDVSDCEINWVFPVKDCGNKWKILLLHPMLVNEKTLMIDGKIKQVNINEAETDADIALCGHYHDGFDDVVKTVALEQESYWVNPGSMARVEANLKKRNREPRLAHLKIFSDRFDIKFVTIPHRPFGEIFDVEHLKHKKFEKIDKDHFTSALKTLAETSVMEDNFVEALASALRKPPAELSECVDKEVIQYCLEKVEEFK